MILPIALTKPLKVVRIAVIGTGFGSRTHIPIFGTLPGVEIVGVASRTFDRAQAIAAKFGIPNSFDNYLEMLEQVEPHLVCVATPPHIQKEMVLTVINRGINLLCEKPMGLNLNDAKEITQRAQGTDLVTGVSYEFRYAPSREIIRKHIQAGLIGEVRMVLATEYSCLLTDVEQPFESWVTNAEMGGGLRGFHTIDTLLSIVGPIDSLISSGRVFLKRRGYGDRQIEASACDAIAVLINFSNNAIGLLSISPVMPQGCRRLEIRGSKGTIILSDEKQILFGKLNHEVEEIWRDETIWNSNASTTGDHILINRCFKTLAENIIKGIRGEESCYPTLKDGLAVQSVFDSIRISSETGTITPVKQYHLI